MRPERWSCASSFLRLEPFVEIFVDLRYVVEVREQFRGVEIREGSWEWYPVNH